MKESGLCCDVADPVAGAGTYGASLERSALSRGETCVVFSLSFKRGRSRRTAKGESLEESNVLVYFFIWHVRLPSKAGLAGATGGV